MSRNLLFPVLMLSCAVEFLNAKPQAEVSDPAGKTEIRIVVTDGVAECGVWHSGKHLMDISRLGFVADIGDFSKLELESVAKEKVTGDYRLDRIKKSDVHYSATRAVCRFKNPLGQNVDVEFMVSPNDVAFRYLLPKDGDRGSVRILDELTEFCFLDDAAHSRVRTYLTPQSHAMVDWKRTKPSYEEHYGIGKLVSEPSEFGHGYTFPCLFEIVDKGWVLVSETGVDGRYCASRLGECALHPCGKEFRARYEMEFPMPEENNGNGTVEPAFSIPGATPWRTITLGETLKPIVETTVTWNHVAPRYESENKYVYGKGAWSWIVWQDASMNMEDQMLYVDLAAEMGFDYLLVDAGWDMNLGYDGLERLAAYASSKNVDLFLWYSSSGWWNDIVQSPVNVMCDPVQRKKDMRWMRSLGIKGIKVDFFGGDKQETMRYYDAILSDADDHGLMVIFHGCTLPRGWERMYPNYVGSEAVRASENMVFKQSECDMEAVCATLHPFVRNAVGCMEYGGCFLNRRLDRTGERGNIRRTTDVFQLATCVLYQNPVQNFALTPDNLTGSSPVCLDFIREVPVVWDDTVYISGRPGESVVLARRYAGKWYVAAVNAQDVPLEVKIEDILAGLDCNPDEIAVISGGNIPERKNSKADAVLTVNKNDGVVLIIS